MTGTEQGAVGVVRQKIGQKLNSKFLIKKLLILNLAQKNKFIHQIGVFTILFCFFAYNKVMSETINFL